MVANWKQTLQRFDNYNFTTNFPISGFDIQGLQKKSSKFIHK